MKTTSKLFSYNMPKEIQAILDEVESAGKQQVQGRNTPDQLQPHKCPKTPAPIPHLQQPVTVEERECMNLVILTISSDEGAAILVYGTKADIEEIGGMIESSTSPIGKDDTIFVMVII